MALRETTIDRPRRQGKVRDIYDLGDRLLLVATDRISAFDWVLPTPIPDKGRVLTALSAFWFERLGVPHHLISTDLDAAGLDLTAEQRADLTGRIMVCRKCRVVPFECVVRGYLSGSGWREYRASGTVCGSRLAEAAWSSRTASTRTDLHPGDQGRGRPRRERLARGHGLGAVGARAGRGRWPTRSLDLYRDAGRPARRARRA